MNVIVNMFRQKIKSQILFSNSITHKKIYDFLCVVSKKQNEELYKEIADLLGLYPYTKDKVHIKPYVIIRE